MVKNLPDLAGDMRQGFDLWVRKIPWRAWQPTPIFLATHSNILVWRIPWTEKPGGLYSP